MKTKQVPAWACLLFLIGCGSSDSPSHLNSSSTDMDPIDVVQADVMVSDMQPASDAGIPADGTVDATVDAAVAPPCVYPDNSHPLIALDESFPPLVWPDAVGSNGSVSALNLEDVYCRRGMYSDVTAIIFVVAAGWDPISATALQAFENARADHARLQQTFDEEHLLVWVLTADNDENLVNSSTAAMYFDRFIAGAPGYRVGTTADPPTNHPVEDPFSRRAIVNPETGRVAFPYFLFVATGDMRIAAPSRAVPEELQPYFKVP